MQTLDKGMLSPRYTPGADVTRLADGWRLSIPAGAPRTYRLAQLDDYSPLPRRRFHWNPPVTLSLQARVSAANLPGTWGFGLWNDPSGFSLGFGGKAGRLPALPQAAWFFYGSLENHLSFQPDEARTHPIPANGFFAGAFRSVRVPALMLVPGLPALPFLALRPSSRAIRRMARRIIRQDGAAVDVDVTAWHHYSISWLREGIHCSVDDRMILDTPLSPHPPLGLVIWIDNQYAAWTPEGRLAFGTLGNPAAWLEVKSIQLSDQ